LAREHFDCALTRWMRKVRLVAGDLIGGKNVPIRGECEFVAIRHRESFDFSGNVIVIRGAIANFL